MYIHKEVAMPFYNGMFLSLLWKVKNVLLILYLDMHYPKKGGEKIGIILKRI
jgi:hypothetical protein